MKEVVALFTPSATKITDNPVSCDELSHIEENAIRYTAGALLRKAGK